MPESQEIAGFKVVKAVGQGAHSKIYCVQDMNGQLFALKVVERDSPADQRFLDQAILEHEVSSQFDHPLLRKSFRVLRERKLIRTSTIRVLMEYVEGKPLEQFRTAEVSLQAELCRQIGEGLAVMHAKGFVHADMKPNNVLVGDDGKVKIIDFGQSCAVNTRKERVQGTPDYIAPEQVRKEHLTAQTDVFNLGATMYWLLTGEHVPTMIPKTKKNAGTLKVERDVETPADLNPSVPPALSSVVMNCIEPDPMDRPKTMREVVDRIRIAQSQVERSAGNAEPSGSGPDDDEPRPAVDLDDTGELPGLSPDDSHHGWGEDLDSMIGNMIGRRAEPG
ncbi:MAG: serine/threonine-protein kinase [Planctomycetota bacterium]